MSVGRDIETMNGWQNGGVGLCGSIEECAFRLVDVSSDWDQRSIRCIQVASHGGVEIVAVEYPVVSDVLDGLSVWVVTRRSVGERHPAWRAIELWNDARTGNVGVAVERGREASIDANDNAIRPVLLIAIRNASVLSVGMPPEKQHGRQ